MARYVYEYNDSEWHENLPQTRNLLLSELEQDLISIREDAVKRISKNTDGVFTIYGDIPFSLIPVIKGKNKKVYAISCTLTDDFLFLGNDYKLSYNKRNKFRGVERIHKSLIKLPLKNTALDKNAIATLHNHSI